MKVRELISALIAIDEVSVLDSDVFFRIPGEENDSDVEFVAFTDTGDIILSAVDISEKKGQTEINLEEQTENHEEAE